MNTKGILASSALTFILVQLLSMALPVPVHAASVTIVPTSGTVGTSISIQGKGFAGRLATIHWDKQIILRDIPISETGELACSLKVPRACKGRHTIKITDDSNWTSSTASTTFTVLPSIRVFPRIGRVYTTITIIGTGFTAFERDIRITWDGKALPVTATANHLGTWSINFDVTETTKGDHFIGAFSNATPASEIGEVKFLLAPVAKVTPLSGTVGSEIKIEGFGFRTGEDGITITWDGEIIMCNIVGGPDGSWSVTLKVPPSVRGYHTIGVYGSSFTPKGVVPDTTFEVLPQIQLEPSAGNKGTKVTIKGTGFAQDETVTISFNETKLDITTVADGTGSFNVAFESPQSRLKENTITASGDKGNSAQAVFIMEKTAPPPPELLSPAQKAELEIFDSVGDVFLEAARHLVRTIAHPLGLGQLKPNSLSTTFDWSDSDSAHNIRYVLQITRGDDFSSPTLVKANLIESEYTLSREDKVTRGNYSWRVKAIDDVGNESQWSKVHQFNVTLMSPQVLVLSLTIPLLIIAAIVSAIAFTWRTRRLKR